MTKNIEVVDREGDSDTFKHRIFKVISSGDSDNVDDLRQFLDYPPDHPDHLQDINLEDDSGMSLLMHAAWKGKENSAKFLIQQGADVNGGHHEHDYTALHFAALAGKVGMCKILVENGAKVEAVNTVKRTPAQMAAFVGNSGCVSVINNYVPKEDVFYFTQKQPLEDKAKLEVELALPIHNLVMSMNTHPVRIGLILKNSPIMLQNVGKVCRILELMSERQFKDRRDVNEVLSLKFHIIYYIVKDIDKQMAKDAESISEKNTPFIDRWIKSMLIGRPTDGYPIFQEDFLRQGIKEFPFKESQLFKVLVTGFSSTAKYGEGATAAECINQAFNGQQGFKDFENCSTCGNEKAEKKCASCKSVQYCDQICQKYHWFSHKKACPNLKAQYEKFVKNKKSSEISGKAEEEKMMIDG